MKVASPLGSSPFAIKFAPSDINNPALRTATVTIVNNDATTNAGSYTFVIQGTAAELPVMQVQSNSHTISAGDITPVGAG